jgi:hypothetical protein
MLAMAKGPNGESEDFQPRPLMGVRGTQPESDRRATSMGKYRVDQWQDCKPSLARRLIDRLRNRSN